ncbi:hypothetical protein Pd630_LPD08048 [Rhodococcus opacus PD630]|nr:hypothetical protein Pd630_LPD08048 [Rhodococcus opacus PD630]
MGEGRGWVVSIGDTSRRPRRSDRRLGGEPSRTSISRTSPATVPQIYYGEIAALMFHVEQAIPSTDVTRTQP